MIRFIMLVFFAVGMFHSTVHAGEEYEFLHCYTGKTKPMHESKDLNPIVTYKMDGIIMSKSENKFLDNASTHCEGFLIGKIPSPTMKMINYCIVNDPDGDMLIWGSPQAGGVAEQNLMHGTGKYKGIKGSFTSKVIARAKKPLKTGTFQQCRLLNGEFEMLSN